eukprot:jgi/Astpho2/7220/fgenesh1_pg.00113_%23_47_t
MQVDELLAMDADNEEYRDLQTSLVEVIQLTRDLLQESLQAEAAMQGAGEVQEPAPKKQRRSRFEPVVPGAMGGQPAAAPVQVAPPNLQIPSILPPQVAEQIRAAQQKAALSGQAPAAWAIGARCEALYAGDGQWYSATVKGVTGAGNFLVSFDEYGIEEEVDRQNARPRPEGAEIYRGVQAPRRKAVNEPSKPEDLEMPAWLEIKETDDEKTKAKKKKLQKSHKSKQRFARLDAETQQRQQSWQNFKKGKGSQKKAGFFTGKQKGSIFSVPDNPDAKVGVTGSGNPMTEFKPVPRFNAGADLDE